MPGDPLTWLLDLELVGIKLGLHNIQALLDGLGRPERAYRTVHIGGTNGKGSVTAMVTEALLAAGHRAARYTSPHLVDLTERMVVAGRPVDPRVLTAVVDDIRRLAADLSSCGELSGPPTFFEVTTAAAFEVFRRADAEVAVCEVGLGGRLDATNVLVPEATAITSIGLDHQPYLGGTLREIAAEKAGIIKTGVPVVIGSLPAEALDTIASIARSRGAPLVNAAADVTVDERPALTVDRPFLVLRTPMREYGPLTPGLAGAHQVENAVVATRLLETLDERGLRVPATAVVDGLSSVRWPGRLESRRFADGRELLLDAAHNPDGCGALARFLARRSPATSPIVFGTMRDKDAAGMLRHLAPVASAFVITRGREARFAEPDALAAVARAAAPAASVIIEPDVGEALAAAWRLSPRIVVAGSIFLLGEVMKRLERP